METLQVVEPSVRVRGNWDDLLVNGYKGRLSLEKPSRVFFSAGRIYRCSLVRQSLMKTERLAFASAH